MKPITPSQAASALGKLAKGKAKTGLSDAERKRRSNLAIANLLRIAASRSQK